MWTEEGKDEGMEYDDPRRKEGQIGRAHDSSLDMTFFPLSFLQTVFSDAFHHSGLSNGCQSVTA